MFSDNKVFTTAGLKGWLSFQLLLRYLEIKNISREDYLNIVEYCWNTKLLVLGGDFSIIFCSNASIFVDFGYDCKIFYFWFIQIFARKNI